jgi:hypothetical protein
MSEYVNFTLERKIRDLASDCRIDREDAEDILESTLEDLGTIKSDRKRIVDLVRRCAAKMDRESFAMFKDALQDNFFPAENRILLKPGAKGREVRELRSALGAAGKMVKDRRIDPGPGSRYDAATTNAVRALQAWASKPMSGVMDSDTLSLLNFVLTETDHPLFDPERLAKNPRGISLHFYPGERKMEVLQKGKAIDTYDMRGGPEKARPDTREGNHVWGPTPKGVYTIRSLGKHISRTWKNSQIPWGAKIREHDGVIQFQNREGTPWRDATGPNSVFRNREEHMQLDYEDFVQNNKVVETWERNDFGHMTVYLTKNSKPQNHMIHATPRNERRYADDNAPLYKSHGCEHLRPADLDEALAKGYLRPGVRFVVHNYDERIPTK